MGVLSLPEGVLYMNSIARANCIAFTDSPEKSEIMGFFKQWQKAEKLIYKRGSEYKEYLRKDYVNIN